MKLTISFDVSLGGAKVELSKEQQGRVLDFIENMLGVTAERRVRRKSGKRIFGARKWTPGELDEARLIVERTSHGSDARKKIVKDFARAHGRTPRAVEVYLYTMERRAATPSPVHAHMADVGAQTA